MNDIGSVNVSKIATFFINSNSKYQQKFIYCACKCAYSITIFLKDIQELFARIWEKSLQLSYLYMSLSSGVQCIVRFYVSTLLTRVVLFWHFNTQNLQDKQNFSHALRISCSFWQRLWNQRLSCGDDFLVHLLFKCSDIF